MRTTLNIDDEILVRVKEYASRRDLPLGQAASDLIRRGLEGPIQTKALNGLQVVVLPQGSPVVSSERIRMLLDDEI